MAKYWFTSLMTSHYDTPGTLTKISWFVTKKLSTLKSKDQVGATICSAYNKNKYKNYTHRKLNKQQSNQNAEKIAINRNEYSYILSIYTNAKITLYSMSNNKV